MKQCLPTSLPYAHLNLRRNPFGELPDDERAELAKVDVTNVVERLTRQRYAVQFVGDKGFGKTTHLLAIRAHFPTAGYVHIPEGETAALPTGRPVLIDEAQRLTRWQQWTLFRASVPLVLGTHRDFTSQLRRAGRTVETIAVEQGTSEHRLHKLLNARICRARRDAGPVPNITEATATDLLQQFGPDIRRTIHEMYVTFQHLSGVCDV